MPVQPDQPRTGQPRGSGSSSRRWGSLRGGAGVGIVAGTAALGAGATIAMRVQPGRTLGVCIVVGTVIAALAVRPRAGRLIFPVPVLSYLIAALIAGIAYNRSTSKTELVIGAAQWVADGFFLMALATALAIVLITARWLLGRRAARASAATDWPGSAGGTSRRPRADRDEFGTTGARDEWGARGERGDGQPPRDRGTRGEWGGGEPSQERGGRGKRGDGQFPHERRAGGEWGSGEPSHERRDPGGSPPRGNTAPGPDQRNGPYADQRPAHRYGQYPGRRNGTYPDQTPGQRYGQFPDQAAGPHYPDQAPRYGQFPDQAPGLRYGQFPDQAAGPHYPDQAPRYGQCPDQHNGTLGNQRNGRSAGQSSGQSY